ncbi:hypothetical protein J3459_011922 [Metarhizium acridum]|uniref:uncharacterized protein n=1 Tax=Metarhizium acridum TaxID=92637 RepID=UPI001C6A9A32|nr:hypothetical protein J3458_022108 [Metarhizium acridum]KAG8418941.1 hypothetical protein J3459_011922 [Metarhizium acridum]
MALLVAHGLSVHAISRGRVGNRIKDSTRVTWTIPWCVAHNGPDAIMSRHVNFASSTPGVSAPGRVDGCPRLPNDTTRHSRSRTGGMKPLDTGRPPFAGMGVPASGVKPQQRVD